VNIAFTTEAMESDAPAGLTASIAASGLAAAAVVVVVPGTPAEPVASGLALAAVEGAQVTRNNRRELRWHIPLTSSRTLDGWS
jgi:hypothetical protein